MNAGDLRAILGECDAEMPVAIVHVDRMGRAERFRLDALELTGCELVREPATLKPRIGWLLASPSATVARRDALTKEMPTRMPLDRRCGCIALVHGQPGSFALPSAHCLQCGPSTSARSVGGDD